MLRFSALLALFFVSCSSMQEPKPVTQPPTAAVKSRMRGSVPVVIMGLQDQVALQRPTQRSAVLKESLGHSSATGSEIGRAAAGMDRAAVVMLPFLALNILMPPVRALTAGGTVSAKRAEAAAQKMHARAARRNWGEAVRQSIVRGWSGRGSAFSSVRIYHPASATSGPDPLSRESLANLSGNVLLFIHVVGPSLAAEGDKLNPRIGPSLLLHWKVVENRSGNVLARGMVVERSPLRKTLLEWADHDDAGMVPEMERVIRAAGARLAAELR